MLRAEQCHQLHSRRLRQQIDRAPPLRIDPSLIRDEAHTLAAKRREPLLLPAPRYLSACAGSHGKCKMIAPVAASASPRPPAAQQGTRVRRWYPIASRLAESDENGNETCVTTLDCAGLKSRAIYTLGMRASPSKPRNRQRCVKLGLSSLALLLLMTTALVRAQKPSRPKSRPTAPESPWVEQTLKKMTLAREAWPDADGLLLRRLHFH